MFEDVGMDVAMLCSNQNDENRKKIESHSRINFINESIRSQHVKCKFDVFQAVQSCFGWPNVKDDIG